MKQYTKEEIAARTKVAWLATDDSHYKSICATEPINFNGEFFCDQEPGCLPDNKWVIGENKLHNPDQYPWPEPGQCVEYRLEPSLEDDLRGLVSLLDKQISQLDDISAFNLIYEGALSMGKAYKSALEDIINKHYPEL